MERMTKATLNHRERTLNGILGLPQSAVIERKWQIGNIHAQGINGGYQICQVCNEAGGIKTLAYGLTMREAADWLQAAATGAQMALRQEVGQ